MKTKSAAIKSRYNRKTYRKRQERERTEKMIYKITAQGRGKNDGKEKTLTRMWKITGR